VEQESQNFASWIDIEMSEKAMRRHRHAACPSFALCPYCSQ